MDTLQLAISDDRQTLTITFPAAPGISLLAGTTRVEGLIDALAAARSQMLPAVPSEWVGGQAAAGQRDPAWVCEREALRNDALLHVRHPGLGWVHFSISAAHARSLGQHLIKLAETADRAAAQDKPN